MDAREAVGLRVKTGIPWIGAETGTIVDFWRERDDLPPDHPRPRLWFTVHWDDDYTSNHLATPLEFA